MEGWVKQIPNIPSFQHSSIPICLLCGELILIQGGIMAITREQVIRLVAEKVGPAVALEAKMEKGFWRVTLTQEDYLERGEYQQEIAFETRINKALKGLKDLK
jgi:hypothetical protein